MQQIVGQSTDRGLINWSIAKRVLCQMLNMPQAISLTLNSCRPMEDAERNIRKDMQMLPQLRQEEMDRSSCVIGRSPGGGWSDSSYRACR
ncbi:hypothetical protein MKX08_008098 [Trichoderma sp. CBMAI-0020]|nr:hypothetical protein MKX08_008098 [Trichoderma sp. CBMAI-0020]